MTDDKTPAAAPVKRVDADDFVLYSGEGVELTCPVCNRLLHDREGNTVGDFWTAGYEHLSAEHPEHMPWLPTPEDD